LNHRKRFALVAAGLSAACLLVAAEPTPPSPVTRPTTGPAVTAATPVVAAADAFLATLDPKLRARVLYKFTDEAQRARWSNFPTGFIPRGGVALKDMTPPQQSAAMALVASALSRQGMAKVRQRMDADEVLKSQPDNGPGGGGGPPGGGGPGRRGRRGPRPNSTSGPISRPNGGAGDRGPDDRGPRDGGFGGPGGGGPPGGGFVGGGPGGGGQMFGKDLYYISILGTPSETKPWMLQFGGHHLALNLTIVGERGVLTPTLTGAQPDRYEGADGKDVRVLAAEDDKAFALLDALDAGQRKRAILNYEVGDLVLGPGHDGETIQPEGLKGSDMTAPQKAMLMDLIAEWAGIVNDAYAAPRLAEIRAGLDQTWFAWSGPTTHEPGRNGTAYYRVQGPKLVIEFAPQGMGGDPTNHVHTMYRDPTDDYGRADTAAH
jgi:hypothetical protein